MPIYAIRLKNRKPVPGTLERLSPYNEHFCKAMVTKDGNEAVFGDMSNKRDAWSVWLAQTNGSRCINITQDFRIAGTPFWTPNEKHIIFSGCRELPKGIKTTKEIKKKKIKLYTNIFIGDRDGMHKTQLTKGNYYDIRPCISPDGKTIVFMSNRCGLKSLQPWKLDIASGELDLIDSHDGINYRPCFSRDGKYLAYHSTKNQKYRENILVKELTTGKEWNPIKLKKHEWIHGAFWLNDSKSILFHGNLSGLEPARLFILDITSNNYHVLHIPGFQSCAHGSIDDNETTLVFDSKQRLLPSLHAFLFRCLRIRS